MGELQRGEGQHQEQALHPFLQARHGGGGQEQQPGGEGEQPQQTHAEGGDDPQGQAYQTEQGVVLPAAGEAGEERRRGAGQQPAPQIEPDQPGDQVIDQAEDEEPRRRRLRAGPGPGQHGQQGRIEDPDSTGDQAQHPQGSRKGERGQEGQGVDLSARGGKTAPGHSDREEPIQYGNPHQREPAAKAESVVAAQDPVQDGPARRQGQEDRKIGRVGDQDGPHRPCGEYSGQQIRVDWQERERRQHREPHGHRQHDDPGIE